MVPDVRGLAFVFVKGTLEDAGFAWRVAGFALAAAAVPRLALGAFSGPLLPGPWDLVLAVALAGVLVHRVARRLGLPELAGGAAPRPPPPGRPSGAFRPHPRGATARPPPSRPRALSSAGT